MTHVANGDMVTLSLVQGVVNTFVIFLSRVIGNIIDRAVFRSDDGRGIASFVTVIVLQLLLGILANMIVMWFSRRREFRADRRSEEHTSELQSPCNLVCRLLLEKKKK